MQDFVLMNVVGITYNQIESGIYAVILKEADGEVRVPILIGEAEAQAIECRLQNVSTPRPLTHDLYINTLTALGYSLRSIEIYMLSSGVFAANLRLMDSEGETVTVDARSSDAIALAIRANAKILMEREIIVKMGFMTAQKESGSERKITQPTPEAIMSGEFDLSKLEDEILRDLFDRSVSSEYYELAARLKQEIKRRIDSDSDRKEI